MRFSSLFPSRSLHPLLRALLLVAGAALMAFLVIFGAMAMLAVAAAGGAWLSIQRWRARHGRDPAPAAHARAQPRRVLEGEYVVVDRPNPR